MSFKSVMGGILNVAGSVLSFIPVVGPIVGAGVSAVGQGLSKSASLDAVAAGAAQVAANQKAALAMNNAAANSLTTSSIFDWIQNNLAIVALGVGAVVIFVFKPFKHRR